MQNTNAKIPVIISFSGHDPSGGAGIAADIATLEALNCHSLPIITCITLQDTTNVYSTIPLDPEIIKQQAEIILKDVTINAIKIGLIDSPKTIAVIAEILLKQKNIPVILDPIINAGGGKQLLDNAALETLTNVLLPLTTLITPNIVEAKALANVKENTTIDSIAEKLLAKNINNILITGADSEINNPQVTHYFYSNNFPKQTFNYKRLPHKYHGSGCTLANAIAAFIAHKYPINIAVSKALDFSYLSCVNAYKIGNGQLIPNRKFNKQNTVNKNAITA